MTPPRRRWGRRLLAGALVLGMAYCGWLSWYGMEYQRAAAETDRLDPGWRWDELQAKRPAVPDAENAALVILGLKGRWPAGLPSGPLHVQLMEELAPAVRLTPAQAFELRGCIAQAAPALAEARRLAGYDRGRFPVAWPESAMTPRSDRIEAPTTARWLRLDAIDRIEAGDEAGAWTAIRAAFACSRAFADDPYTRHQLAGRDCRWQAVLALERLLAQFESPAADLAAVQSRLVASEPADVWLILARGVRAEEDRTWEWLRQHLPLRQRLLLQFRHPESSPARNRAPLLRWLTALVEALKRPAAERNGRVAALVADIDGLPEAAADSARGVVQFSRVAVPSGTAQVRAAVAALAAERFRLAHGRWPASLEELVSAGLLDTVPLDPFDGQPLRFRRLADGLTIYAVGADGSDDGGTQLQRGGRGLVPADIGFRLWDVAARRQPPPATPGDQP